jgi:hypothetical protein
MLLYVMDPVPTSRPGTKGFEGIGGRGGAPLREEDNKLMPPFSRTFPFSGSISVLTHARTRPCNWPLKQSDSSRLAVRAAGRKKAFFRVDMQDRSAWARKWGPK